MSMYFRYPNITGKTEREQINQIERYLFQFIDQLNYVLPLLEGATQNNSATENQGGNNAAARNTDT